MTSKNSGKILQKLKDDFLNREDLRDIRDFVLEVTARLEADSKIPPIGIAHLLFALQGEDFISGCFDASNAFKKTVFSIEGDARKILRNLPDQVGIIDIPFEAFEKRGIFTHKNRLFPFLDKKPLTKFITSHFDELSEEAKALFREPLGHYIARSTDPIKIDSMALAHVLVELFDDPVRSEALRKEFWVDRSGSPRKKNKIIEDAVIILRTFGHLDRAQALTEKLETGQFDIPVSKPRAHPNIVKRPKRKKPVSSRHKDSIAAPNVTSRSINSEPEKKRFQGCEENRRTARFGHTFGIASNGVNSPSPEQPTILKEAFNKALKDIIESSPSWTQKHKRLYKDIYDLMDRECDLSRSQAIERVLKNSKHEWARKNPNIIVAALCIEMRKRGFPLPRNG